MQVYRLISLSGILAVALFLSACDVSTPSRFTTGKIRVKEQMVTEVLDAGRIDPARVNVIADGFVRNARGGMTLAVSYPSGDSARKDSARKQGDAYKKSFEQRGASNISVVTVPVAHQQYTGRVLVTYKALAAVAAKDCNPLPGHKGADNMEAVDQYKFGCETQTAMGRMVADPSDLLGKAGTQKNDSRRSGATVESYKAGTPNQSMQGLQAS